MIHLLIALLAALLLGCGYDPSCFDGCERPKPVIQIVEITKVVKGQPGPKGDKGDTGERGQPGQDAAACGVSQTNGGAIINCPNGSAEVQDGVDGTSAALPSDTVVEVIHLCNHTAGEVVLKTQGGSLYGHYADGANQYLTQLLPGEYETTDGNHCRFTVTGDNQVTWEDTK